MRFKHLGDSQISVSFKVWAFPGTTDFIAINARFGPGEVTEDFPPENPMTQILGKHPAFKPFVIPTIWDRLLTDL